MIGIRHSIHIHSVAYKRGREGVYKHVCQHHRNERECKRLAHKNHHEIGAATAEYLPCIDALDALRHTGKEEIYIVDVGNQNNHDCKYQERINHFGVGGLVKTVDFRTQMDFVKRDEFGVDLRENFGDN